MIIGPLCSSPIRWFIIRLAKLKSWSRSLKKKKVVQEKRKKFKERERRNIKKFKVIVYQVSNFDFQNLWIVPIWITCPSLWLIFVNLGRNKVDKMGKLLIKLMSNQLQFSSNHFLTLSETYSLSTFSSYSIASKLIFEQAETET